MVAHSFLSALAFAVTLSEVAIGASVSGPTMTDISLQPRGWFGSSTAHFEAHEIVEKWSSIPGAFAQCQSVFQQRADVTVAVQAVQALYTQVESLSSQYSSCSCNQISSQQTYTTQFRETITQVFTQWQSILVTGQQVYGDRWETSFKSEFQKFGGFLKIVKSLCASLKIDLSALIRGLGLNVELFVGVGINVNVLLGGVLGAVSGLLDAPKALLGGVLGH